MYKYLAPFLFIVASCFGQTVVSTYSVTAGIFSTSVTTPLVQNAGTLAFSATGANTVTVTANSVLRATYGLTATLPLRLHSAGNTQFQLYSSATNSPYVELSLQNTSGTPYSRLQSGDGLAYRALTINPLGGNVLFGNETDNGISKVQITGSARISSSLAMTGATTHTYNLTWGAGFFQMGSERASSGSGSDFYVGPATSAAAGSTNENGGDIAIIPGTATGNGSGAVLLYGVATGSSGTTDSVPILALTATGDYVSTQKELRVGQSAYVNGNLVFQASNSTLKFDIQNPAFSIIAGTTTGTDPRFLMFGSTHGTNANQTYLDSDVFSVRSTAGTNERFRANATGIGFFGVTPVARQSALTGANASALNTGDATSDTVIGNIRTRLGELETKLQAYGLLN